MAQGSPGCSGKAHEATEAVVWCPMQHTLLLQPSSSCKCPSYPLLKTKSKVLAYRKTVICGSGHFTAPLVLAAKQHAFCHVTPGQAVGMRQRSQEEPSVQVRNYFPLFNQFQASRVILGHRGVCLSLCATWRRQIPRSSIRNRVHQWYSRSLSGCNAQPIRQPFACRSQRLQIKLVLLKFL